MKILLDIADKNKEIDFVVRISGSEGYAKAEVTAGGVDADELFF
ncbi:MAG UNVERIFIED_CONTAM: NAD(P)/FAD-dependent oxidoreductase [Rickettsiaceae bacterium]|jgi:predicted flavoprotein YhiN